MPEFEKVTGTEPDLDRVQKRVFSSQERHRSPFDNGVFLKMQLFQGEVKRLQHGLKRKPKGFLVTSVLPADNTAGNLTEGVTVVMTNSSTKACDFRSITASSTEKIDVEVYVF